MTRETFALWEQIFKVKAFDLSEDLHFVTPTEIKAIVNKEPRLMAKMDNSSDLPPVFKANGYFLLSVGRKGYAIVRGNGFHALETIDNEPEDYASRIKFNLTTSNRSTSEMQYLDYCANAGLTEHVIGDGLLYSSIRGREGSGNFSFKVQDTQIDVESAQIEVDLGLEGQNKIVLMEAKSSTPEDFIIRQLYYPYRRFSVVSPSKEIVPVFFTYDSNLETYNYWIYTFEDLADYNSVRLINKIAYRISTVDEVKIEELNPVADVVYKDLIPQANDLDKVLELVFQVGQGVNQATTIADYFGFDPRQSSYYREAAEALGFVYLESGKYCLTDTGKHFLQLNAEDRNIFFSQVLSNFSLIRQGMDILKSKGSLSKQDVEHLISLSSHLTGTTIGRRADSLMRWFHWIADKTGTFSVENSGFRLN